MEDQAVAVSAKSLRKGVTRSRLRLTDVVCPRGPKRSLWAVKLNLDLSVALQGAPLNAAATSRMRLGLPDSDACSSLGFRV